MSHKVIKSKKVYHGKVFDVRTDEVEGPGGESYRVDVVEHAGAVSIIPVDGEGNIWFIRQYRHAVGKRILELPAGTLAASETPETCAERECREEIGMAPGRLIHLGSAHLAPGYSTEYMHFFLALGLTPSPLPGDPDEDIQVEIHPSRRVREMIEGGEIQDIKTLAGILLSQEWLGANPVT
jgi:ADP-ribose pyrophosphatase